MLQIMFTPLIYLCESSVESVETAAKFISVFCVLRPISELIFYPFHINQLRSLNHCQALCHQIQSFNHFLFKATIVIVDNNNTRQQDRHIRQHQFQPRPTASALITSRQAYFSSSLLESNHLHQPKPKQSIQNRFENIDTIETVETVDLNQTIDTSQSN